MHPRARAVTVAPPTRSIMISARAKNSKLPGTPVVTGPASARLARRELPVVVGEKKTTSLGAPAAGAPERAGQR